MPGKIQPMMSEMLDVPELPFPVTSSHPKAWRRDEQSGRVVVDAPAHTDLYVNPGGASSADAESMLNAATLIGKPPEGDFQLSARVGVDFRSQYDAGVLLLWIDDRHWAKFCFELSPASEPMVVSVVTLGVSDDANAFVVPGRSVWLRISRVDRVYAFHASTDSIAWQLVRVFSLGDRLLDHEVGFEAQSPTGDGCTVSFDEIRFTRQRLSDLRDGS
jgi:regulation of enolase protein 1 (concanavalin A-like superfamily)